MALMLTLSLSACGAQMPPLNFSVPNVGPSQVKLDAEVKSITVTIGRPDEATGPLPNGLEIVPPMWKTSLEEALTKMAIFKDDAPKKVSVSVKILKVDIPNFGGEFTTDVGARYEIIDRSNGSIILTTDVNSKGVVPFDYALIGAVRVRESLNRSIQNNILQFLQQLETTKLGQPMFPSSASPVPAPVKGKGVPTS
ncbi:hypothetical protein ABMY26_19900 [Azospirillum sp. HJ39]|uniref:hypothetical protein n=1 Tax=Azospirillum sp. HJ39 TaxID=3159496 RepID=UPI00355759F9